MGVLGDIEETSEGIIPQSVGYILRYLQNEEDRGVLL